ncbi:AIR synthase related protein [Herbivorax sp. ANBcel31]|uniref:AIR synthase related protein n=1 Tax=Herbivorax sp. ANBcel31 TaxID=3069754 RepID=UPI0027B4A5A9|nr:AIR synthase related protein [Herbivorax sp. ANBcel31]MDQ2087527.1 AIR synthase related protein [Herbivorax sp. ANBcel31]
MDERELIKIVAGMMPKSDAQKNSLFEADCEIVDLGDRKILFNIDEFSHEDYFREDDAYALGWNMAVGSTSDILATGGKPLFYLHSMTVCESWDKKYIEHLSKGISDVLNKTGVAFLGGDMGKSKDWRYTGVVVGEHSKKLIKRSGANKGDVIYITGEVGAGNVEALLKIYRDNSKIREASNGLKNLFKLRHEKSKMISQYATSSTDTSDGVYNGIKNLSNMSKTGFVIKNIPYMKMGVTLSELASIPKMLMFLGECGEYELLFTIKKSDEKEFLNEAKKRDFKFYKLGTMCEEWKKELVEDNIKIDLKELDISGRSFEDKREYIKSLIGYVKENSKYE